MSKHYLKAEITEKRDDGITAVASTALVDRHGEIVEVEGWELKNFKKAPRILWAHDHTIPAIGKATKVWVEGQGKKAKLMFKMAFQDITEFGKQAKELVEQGWIDTFSVGFMAEEMEDNKFTKQELLEISLVNVPANPEAQVAAYKSFADSGIEEEDMVKLGVQPLFVQMLQKQEIMNGKVDSLVQALKADPSGRGKEVVKAQISLSKVIARASDKILENKSNLGRKETVKLATVVKRANEKLVVSLKEESNGKNRRTAQKAV